MSARVFVPGRIEVLGKHTDYAGGSSLLAAVERGFTFDAEPLAGDRIVIVSEDSGEEVGYAIVRGREGISAAADAPSDTFEHGGAGGPPASKVLRPAGRSHGGMSRPGWARYADGVLDRTLGEFGEAACGASIRFRSDLSSAAGLSSSSALVCGLFLALDAVCRFRELSAFRRALPDRQALAAWLSAAEMGGPVGTRGGSEDHIAILCAEAGRIVRYALAPIRYRGAAAVPAGWTFAVGVSGVVADKGGAVQAHYNRLSDLAARAAEAWCSGVRTSACHNLGDALERAGGAGALVAGIRAGAERLGEDAGPLVRRARHFAEECALVDAAFAGLERGDIDAFATAANRSAAVGAELLENQVPETLGLAQLAREIGAPAASPFGGGFGGAVWALVSDADVDRFLDEWLERYRAAFPQRSGAEFFATCAGPPAMTMDVA